MEATRPSTRSALVLCALALSPGAGWSAGCGSSEGDLVFQDFEPRPTLPEPVLDGERPRLVINEVMARNDSTIMGPVDGEVRFPDWVELYNGGEEAVDLSQVTLRDGGGNVWLGMDGILAPGEHLLLWADASAAPYHLPFRLAGAGEELRLGVDGVIVDRLVTGVMEPDTSWARFPDGGQWSLTIRGTPGWTNGNAGSDEIDPAAALFQRQRVTEFHLTLPQASWDSLAVAPYTQVHGSLGFGGAFYRDVGVRIKGRYGSLRSLSQKTAFKVDLNDYAPGQGIRGLNNLTFNNMVQDPSYSHEYLTYALYRAAGLPAPRLGYTRLYVNGEYFGLYLVVESIDDRFLGRWYDDATGHLFEGAYGVDFVPWAVAEFEYDEGPDETDRSDLMELANLLMEPATDENLARLETMVDMEQFLTYMALEVLTLHWDGYTTANNYRVYHDPGTDLFQMIPWGADQTWSSYRFGPYQGGGRLFGFCMGNPGCRARYGQAIRDMVALMESMDLAGLSVALEELLREEMEADPRREASFYAVTTAIASTRQILATWPGTVRDSLEP